MTIRITPTFERRSHTVGHPDGKSYTCFKRGKVYDIADDAWAERLIATGEFKKVIRAAPDPNAGTRKMAESLLAELQGMGSEKLAQMLQAVQMLKGAGDALPELPTAPPPAVAGKMKKGVAEADATTPPPDPKPEEKDKVEKVETKSSKGKGKKSSSKDKDKDDDTKVEKPPKK